MIVWHYCISVVCCSVGAYQAAAVVCGAGPAPSPRRIRAASAPRSAAAARAPYAPRITHDPGNLVSQKSHYLLRTAAWAHAAVCLAQLQIAPVQIYATRLSTPPPPPLLARILSRLTVPLVFAATTDYRRWCRLLSRSSYLKLSTYGGQNKQRSNRDTEKVSSMLLVQSLVCTQPSMRILSSNSDWAGSSCAIRIIVFGEKVRDWCLVNVCSEILISTRIIWFTPGSFRSCRARVKPAALCTRHRIEVVSHCRISTRRLSENFPPPITRHSIRGFF